MDGKHLFSILTVLLLTVTVFFTACARRTNTQQPDRSEVSEAPTQTGTPIVYFTNDISPAGLMAAYEALGLEATGNVAVKVHTGEPGNTHFVRPEFMRGLVQRVN